ncbi:DUF418 domain-containing protein [Glycomyces harbinensis]|uniref:Uncharacterized membrane protein YeiB n=1 Tax=Glycomyces harbinensis TaxID=58114 RepID=A0A1G6USA4_9ACTN|nr:DUF418 domain-containing protein [Glycomyces harbinensis]SDD43447.1 Uncharacterized membrane protein YeiB [Glycomyces harbinensis]
MTTAAQHAPGPPGLRPPTPMPRAERSLAPDIARGAMLLFIAVANVGGYLYGRSVDAYGHLADAGTADHVALFLEQLFMAERSRPMFAILYGFGIAVMASRMFDRGLGAKAVRKVLRRRSLWLLAFGMLHATLLFLGDILAAYGAAGLVALGLVHLSDKALRRWLWASSAFFVLVTIPAMIFFMTQVGGPPSPDMAPYLEQIIGGFVGGSVNAAATIVLSMYLPMLVIGMMMQRAGWFDHAERHLARLRRVFLSGMAVNLASALPVALIALGAWHPSGPVHQVALGVTLLGGVYAGLGYICGFALLAHRWRSRGRRGLPGALAAVGERSLTSYLTQSIIMASLLSPWGFALGEDLGYLGAYGVAVGTWAVTVVLAVLMARAGKRGPFEVLLRRLTYGRER